MKDKRAKKTSDSLSNEDSGKNNPMKLKNSIKTKREEPDRKHARNYFFGIPVLGVERGTYW